MCWNLGITYAISCEYILWGLTNLNIVVLKFLIASIRILFRSTVPLPDLRQE